MNRRCARCGAEFPVRQVDDRHCPPCEREVLALIAADTRRRQPRFAAKDTTGWGPAL